jgi:hypothetical protein
MRFQANYISTSIAGDYCQAMFAGLAIADPLLDDTDLSDASGL